MKRLITFVGFFLLLQIPLWAQYGKIQGKVIDRESGEPLIGATIVLSQTSLGAATDTAGLFAIVAVPAGTYSAAASYAGYTPSSIQAIRVEANQTTLCTILLSRVAMDSLQRWLVSPSVEATVRIITADQLRTIPYKGTENIIAPEPGVVQQHGSLYIRGGRTGELSFSVDGTSATNPLYANEQIRIVEEGIESIQLYTGGYPAEFGGSNSGIVRTTMKTGGSKLRITADLQTDDFAKPGSEFLGTTSNGYRRGVVTVGGPVMDGIRFFLLGNHNYMRNKQNMFLEPFRIDDMQETGGYSGIPKGTPFPNNGTLEFKKNYLYNNWSESNAGQGNVLFDLDPLLHLPLKVRFTGGYRNEKTINGGAWPDALKNYFLIPRKLPLTETSSLFGTLHFTHILSPSTFYEVRVGGTNRFSRTYDQDFGDEWMKYTDSVANYALGYVRTSPSVGNYGWTRYGGPPSWGYLNLTYSFSDPTTPNFRYSKERQSSTSVSLDFTSQITSFWEIKAGGQLEEWSMRYWSIGNIGGYLRFRDPGKDGVLDPDDTILAADIMKGIPLDRARRIRFASAGIIRFYGYSVDGDETEGVFLSNATNPVDKPYKPSFGSMYVQNRIESENLALNFGVRYEYIAPRFKRVDPTPNLITGEYDYMEVPVDPNLSVVPENYIKESDPFHNLLPRLSISLCISEHTKLYVQYGKYVQVPPYEQLSQLDQFYVGDIGFSNAINPMTRSPYGGKLAFTAQPERLTSAEVGLLQRITDNLTLTLAGYYKYAPNLVQLRPVYATGPLHVFSWRPSTLPALFTSYQNPDIASMKGIELTLEMRRTNRIAARFAYALSDTRGTGSSTSSNAVAASDEYSARFPESMFSMPFNQRHRGSLQFDYRFGDEDGGVVLENMGMNLIVSFNSGHPFTRVSDDFFGSWTWWNVGVYSLRDARMRRPIEPPNVSTTPWVVNVDLTWNKVFSINGLTVEVYANVFNLFNTKQIMDVFPVTGSPDNDGWLATARERFPVSYYPDVPGYESLYRIINLQNRNAIMGTSVGDTYGPPRQIRIGVRVEI